MHTAPPHIIVCLASMFFISNNHLLLSVVLLIPSLIACGSCTMEHTHWAANPSPVSLAGQQHRPVLPAVSHRSCSGRVLTYSALPCGEALPQTHTSSNPNTLLPEQTPKLHATARWGQTVGVFSIQVAQKWSSSSQFLSYWMGLHGSSAFWLLLSTSSVLSKDSLS